MEVFVKWLDREDAVFRVESGGARIETGRLKVADIQELVEELEHAVSELKEILTWKVEEKIATTVTSPVSGCKGYCTCQVAHRVYCYNKCYCGNCGKPINKKVNT